MERKITQWANCSPDAMSRMSQAAIFYALDDAKRDILKLDAENKQMREILRQIAYPKYGTGESSMDVQDFADAIQAIYTLEQLEAQ